MFFNKINFKIFKKSYILFCDSRLISINENCLLLNCDTMVNLFFLDTQAVGKNRCSGSAFSGWVIQVKKLLAKKKKGISPLIIVIFLRERHWQSILS